MEIQTTRLLLRDFSLDDYADLRTFQNHPDTYRFEGNPPSEEETREYLRNAVTWSQQEPRTRYCLAITILPHDIVRGRLKLSLRDPSINEWEIGWMIHPNDWGKGYAPEAATGVLNFAFSELNAHRIMAFTNIYNIASTRVMEKIGMQREGQMRESRWWNDHWCDEYVYAILDHEWEMLKRV